MKSFSTSNGEEGLGTLASCAQCPSRNYFIYIIGESVNDKVTEMLHKALGPKINCKRVAPCSQMKNFSNRMEHRVLVSAGAILAYR